MYELKLFNPPYESELVDLIQDLNHLRRKKLGGSTHPAIFFQLKNIFHTLESLGSARIEGNRTTIAEFIETKIRTGPTPKVTSDEKIREIENGERALAYIDHHIGELNGQITHSFLSELHKTVVDGLTPNDSDHPDSEGSKTPGSYRNIPVTIGNSEVVTAEFALVPSLMSDLLTFIANPDPEKYDLLKTSIAHHRFTIVHPFDNGNGRTVRLFTYAMLVKQGFNVHIGRIINPTAIFCSDRKEYYRMLSVADAGTEEALLAWSTYVLKGLKVEIEKVDKLLNYDYLSKNILLPTIRHAQDRKLITNTEDAVLRIAVDKQVIQQSDIKHLFPGKDASQISRVIKKLLNDEILKPERGSQRKYILNFENNYLLRGVIGALDTEGFLPAEVR